MICPESQLAKPVSPGSLGEVQDSGAVPHGIHLGHGSDFGVAGRVWAGLAAPLHLPNFTSSLQERREK